MRTFLLIACLAGAGAAPAQSIADLALASPPEFAADGLLRLLESAAVTDPKASAAMAQQAFDLASSAQFRVQLTALPNLPADTREGSLARAYALKLDALSLQSRAIVAMAAIHPAQAREMFRSMAKPELPPLACGDALEFDVAAPYRALAVVLTGFTAKERAREDHVSFLFESISQIHSSAQLAPMDAAIQSANLTPQQKEAVVARFNGQIQAFAAAKNASEKRCDAEPKTQPYWESAAAQRLMASARQLRFGPANSKVLSDSERGASEWMRQLEDFDKELAAWEPASEKSEMVYYQQKCIVYQALVELIPPGPRRDRAMQSFARFVAGSNLQSQSRVEWFLPVAAMLERVRNTNNGEPAKLLAALADSGNPVLALCAAQERLHDRRLPLWVSSP